MTSVQLENGYVKIANNLYEELCSLPFSGYELRTVHALIRKTYGFNKSKDRIALSQLAEVTKIAKPHMSRTINNLISMGVVTKIGNNLGINKDYSSWKVTKNGKGGKLPKLVKGVTKIGNKKLPIQEPQNTKDTITKDIISKDITAKQFGNEEINQLISYMKTRMQLEKLDNTVEKNRRYANLCVKKFGFERTKMAIDAASMSKFWNSQVTNFMTLYYNANKIVKSARGEVKSYDATKVLHSTSGKRGSDVVGGRVLDTQGRIIARNESGVVLR